MRNHLNVSDKLFNKYEIRNKHIKLSEKPPSTNQKTHEKLMLCRNIVFEDNDSKLIIFKITLCLLCG